MIPCYWIIQKRRETLSTIWTLLNRSLMAFKLRSPVPFPEAAIFLLIFIRFHPNFSFFFPPSFYRTSILSPYWYVFFFYSESNKKKVGRGWSFVWFLYTASGRNRKMYMACCVKATRDLSVMAADLPLHSHSLSLFYININPREILLVMFSVSSFVVWSHSHTPTPSLYSTLVLPSYVT